MTSAKKRTKKANGRVKNESEKSQIAITACHAAKETLIKQRRLNTVEAGGEDITAGNTADGEGFATTSGGAVEGVSVASTAGDAAGGAGVDVDFATAFDAVGEGGGEQISLTSLL